MDYFYEHYFKPQNVIPQNRIFSKEHIIISTIIFALIYLIMRWQKRQNDQVASQKLLTFLGCLMLSLEIFRVCWRTYYFGFSLSNFRFDWCNQICMVLPYIAIFRIEKAYPYIDVLSFIGGVFVLFYPLWVFYDYAGIHTMAVQSMISHGLMVLIPLTMPMASYGYHPDEEKLKKPVIGLCLMLLVAFIMSNALGQNYILMKKADGIPVLHRIPYPYYWIFAGPGMVLGIYYFIKLERLFINWATGLNKPVVIKGRLAHEH